MGHPTDRPEAFRVVGPDGSVDKAVLGTIGLDDNALRGLYRLLRLVRSADREAAALQRQGALAVYGPVLGQEAAQVGSAFALRGEDFVFPAYRELGVALVRGLDLVRYLYGWKGVCHGSSPHPGTTHFAPNTVPVASHLPHAVGWAMGARLDGKRACAIAYFGDGATSEGDFHESCNFAAVFRAPVVFFCQNNQYAISVPLSRQTAVPIYRKADAYGFPGVCVDGNDVLAVYTVTKEALARARDEGVPTLIEAVTYRRDPHSTADDPRRYRTRDEEKYWGRRDPVDAYRRFLEQTGLADAEFFQQVERDAHDLAATLREGVKRTHPGPVTELFDFVFANIPIALARERDEAATLVETAGDSDA
jgi:TPP-dependent pyruvate/acetoin dehydrogenase alpha subunit